MSKGLPHPGYRFPRTCRLTTASAFQQVFANALKSSDGYLTVLARANGADGARLGLAISKRNIRLASDRNRVKRLARETFRLYQHELAGVDFVVMARTAASHANHETLSRSLRKHWAHLVKQCKPSWSPSSSSTDT
ncbi:MAG: ribonuclease P protein component [Methylococcaceae bacterium]|nr:ribonuclease P protein component [Methylococcaceae bacterium]